MLRNLSTLAVFFLSFMSLTAFAKASEISFIANSLYPTAYVENGKVTGLAIELAEAVFKKADVKWSSPTIYPYKRAYETARNGERVILASLARIPSRENTFSWVGKIVDAHQVFVTKSGSVDHTFETAKKLRRVGVLRGSSLEKELVKRGFKNIESVSDEETSFRMVESGRIDAWFTSNVLLAGVLLSEGFEKRDLLNVGNYVNAPVGVYVTASPGFPADELAKLQAAYNELEVEGELDKIRNRYGFED